MSYRNHHRVERGGKMICQIFAIEMLYCAGKLGNEAGEISS